MSSLPIRSTALLVALSLAACGAAEESAPEASQAGPLPEGAELPSDHPPVSTLPQGHPQVAPGTSTSPQTAVAADARTGTAREVLQSAGYTYVRMDFEGEELWVAGPTSPLKVGDEVTVSGLMGMTDFYARSLDRTFDAIVFANTFSR